MLDLQQFLFSPRMFTLRLLVLIRNTKDLIGGITMLNLSILKQLAFEIILALIFCKAVWLLLPKFIRKIISVTLKFMLYVVKEATTPVRNKVISLMAHRRVADEEYLKQADKKAKQDVKAENKSKTSSNSKSTKSGKSSKVIKFPQPEAKG